MDAKSRLIKTDTLGEMIRKMELIFWWLMKDL